MARFIFTAQIGKIRYEVDGLTVLLQFARPLSARDRWTLQAVEFIGDAITSASLSKVPWSHIDAEVNSFMWDSDGRCARPSESWSDGGGHVVPTSTRRAS